MFAAFNRRDFDEALAYVHPDVELNPALTELDVARQYRGHREMRRFFETIVEAWQEYLVEPVETIVTEDGRLLVVERWHARGRQGIEFDFELTDLYEFRDGLVVRIDGFRDKRDALAAVQSGTD